MLQRLGLSGDTGVSFKNPGPGEYSFNDNDEQPTRSSQSSIYACNGNSFLELPYKWLNICHYNICSLTNKLNEIKLLLRRKCFMKVSSTKNIRPSLWIDL